jgi:hypothetical protein
MIRDVGIQPGAGAAEHHRPVRLITATTQTNVIADIVQLGHSFTVEQVGGYCSALAGAVTAQVGVVRPGTVFTSPTLAIATTKTAFQVAAFSALGSLIGGGLPPIIRKGAENNIAFSQAFVVGTGTGQHWGAVRIQMTSAGVVSTKVRSLALAYPSEALALADCPAADADKVNLGTITIRSANNATFTAGTDDLDDTAAAATVNYNNADGFVVVTQAAVTFAAATVARPAMVAGSPGARGCSQPGGLVVTRYTSDGSGALTQGVVDIKYRPWPMNTEAGA